MRRKVLIFLLLLAVTVIVAQPHTAIVGFVDSTGNTVAEEDLLWSAVRLNDYPNDILNETTSLSTTYFPSIAGPHGSMSMLQVQCADFMAPWAPGQVVTINLEQISSGDELQVDITLTDNGGFDTWDPTFTPLMLGGNPNPYPLIVPPVYPLEDAIGITVPVQFEWDQLDRNDGYKISLGTDNPPTNILNMVDLGDVNTYTTDQLALEQVYYWSITPYNSWGEVSNSPVWTFITRDNPSSPANMECYVTYRGIDIFWDEVSDTQNVFYKVFRDDIQINSNSQSNTYFLDELDTSLYGSSFEYKITSYVLNPVIMESEPCDSLVLTFEEVDIPRIYEDFEEYTAFATVWDDWLTVDGDGEATVGFGDQHDFPGENNPGSFMIFEPMSATPQLLNAAPRSGTQYAAAFSSAVGASDNWLISDSFILDPDVNDEQQDPYLDLYLSSYLNQTGMEQVEFCISTGSTDPDDFTVISGDNPIDVPHAWTYYSLPLQDYVGQEIRFAIHHVTTNGLMLMVDDITLIGTIEPDNNDSSETALEVTLPYMQQEEIIYPDNDEDWYMCYINAPVEINAQVTSDESGLELSTYLYGPTPNANDSVTDAHFILSDYGNDALLEYTLLESGYYYLRVKEYSEPATRVVGDYFVSIEATPLTEMLQPSDFELHSDFRGVLIGWDAPIGCSDAGISYNVFRDGVQLNSTPILYHNYLDTPDNLVLNQSYEYRIQSFIDQEYYLESVLTDSIVVTYTQMDTPTFYDDFENYQDFSSTIGNWENVDIDAEATIDFANFDFPGEQNQMAFIAFNPLATTPPLTSGLAFRGSKYLASFNAVGGESNNWVITPNFDLTDYNTPEVTVTFKAKTLTDEMFDDYIRVGMSDGSIDPTDFIIVNPENAILLSDNWVEYSVTVQNIESDNIRLGFQHLNFDGDMLMLDDVVIDINSANPNDSSDSLPMLKTKLNNNYPNPFNPVTTIHFDIKDYGKVKLDIYNVKGQHIKTLVNEEMNQGKHSIVWDATDSPSGVYFYKLKAGTYTKTKKMVLMK